MKTLVTGGAGFVGSNIVHFLQMPSANDSVSSLTVNSLFPHAPADIYQAYGACLFHVSTDCVFFSRKSIYTEEDPPDAEDLYGRINTLFKGG